jgi:hypothetical protein
MAQDAVRASGNDGLVSAGHDGKGEVVPQRPETPPSQSDSGPDDTKAEAEDDGIVRKGCDRYLSHRQPGEYYAHRRAQTYYDEAAAIRVCRFGPTIKRLPDLDNRACAQGEEEERHCDSMTCEERLHCV